MSSAGNISNVEYTHAQFKGISDQHKDFLIRITNKNGTTVTGILTTPFLENNPFTIPVYHLHRLTVNDQRQVVKGNFHMAPPILINTICVLGKSLDVWLRADLDAPRQIAEELRVYPEDEELFRRILNREYDPETGETIQPRPVERPVVKTAVKTSRCCP